MKEDQLIFLISQPRSGSTLTQKLLGAHSKIYTRSEPWLMLHPSYSLKKSGIYSEYNFNTDRKAFEVFVEGLPDGEETYIQSLNEMYLNLYSYYIDGTNCSYFLDKTPRYYLIVNELLKIYPDAKYILLIRNPLAVLGSIINSWISNNWYRLSEFRNDLTRAINEQLDILNNKKKNEAFLIIHYEEMLSDTNEVLKTLFDYISVDFEAGVENYNQKNEKWRFGDQESVYVKDGIDKNNDKKWQQSLSVPQYWRVMYDYLHYIGKDNFEKLGYNFEENKGILMSNMPADTFEDIESSTFPLFSFLDDTRECLIENQKNKNKVIMLNREVKSKVKRLDEKDKKLSETTGKLNDTTKKLNDTTKKLNDTTRQLNEATEKLNEAAKNVVKRFIDNYIFNRKPDIDKNSINTEDRSLRKSNGEILNDKNLSFSVITVVYNDAELLEKTIKSVISQSHKNVEYIVIDGGSTDETLDVIKQYEDYITHWVSEKDSGIYDAMNKGIDLANGDWLNFMNAGDVFSGSDTLVKVLKHACVGKDVVYGDRYYIKKEKRTLQKAKNINTIFQRMPFGHQSAFVRKDVIKKHKFNDTYKFAADYDLLLNLYLSGYQFEYMGFPVCDFLSGGESESGIRPYLEAIKILLDNTKDPVVIQKNDYVQAFRKQARSLIDDYLVIK